MQTTYRYATKFADASGYFLPDNSFVVLAGSRISDHVTPSFELASKWYYALRESLISSGVVKDCIFQQDFSFSSGTAAASVISGHVASGKVAWKPDFR